MTYVKRYPGGFVDRPSTTTPADSAFLNAMETELIRLGGHITNTDIDAAAAIAKSKLAALAIVDADVSAISASKITPGSNGQWIKTSGGATVWSAIQPSDIGGYPSDAAKYLRGDGTWAGSYTAYTPTWASTGTAPAIGNASVLARYLQIGKLVHCYGQIAFGTTSTFGTGQYTFTLPLTATSATQRSLGTVELFDSSTSNYMLGTVSMISTTLFQVLYPQSYGGVIGQVSQLSPWTWAVSDFIAWNFTYEAA